MARSTEEVAFIILVTLQAEQNRDPADTRLRLPFTALTKKIMARQGWPELVFLQGWGLIMTEKLVQVHQQQDDFYPSLTEAGHVFIQERQADKKFWGPRAVLFDSRQWLFIIVLASFALSLGYVLWKKG